MKKEKKKVYCKDCDNHYIANGFITPSLKNRCKIKDKIKLENCIDGILYYEENSYCFRKNRNCNCKDFIPKQPLVRIIREGEIHVCDLCHSSIKTNWYGKKLGCYQPECENYFGKKK